MREKVSENTKNMGVELDLMTVSCTDKSERYENKAKMCEAQDKLETLEEYMTLVPKWEVTDDMNNTELHKEETDENNNNYTKKMNVNSVKKIMIIHRQ